MTRASDLAKLLSGGTISTADNGTQLTLESTDTDANAGPHLRLYRSVAGADSDNLGQIEFSGQDDAGNEFKYAQIESFLVDASNGTEDGYLEFQVGHGGTERVSRLLFSGTEAVINQDSKDLDFRVESDGDANAFFVQGSSGFTGIGTNSPSHALHVLTSTDGSGVSGDDLFCAKFHNAEATDSRSYGVKIQAGSTSSDRALSVVDHDESRNTFNILGNAQVQMLGNHHSAVGVSETLNVNCFQESDGDNYGIFVSGNNANGVHESMRFYNNVNGVIGSITHGATSTAFNTSSDYRLKENISYTFDATTRLKQLKPARFNFIADKDITVDGFIAHEVSSIVPEAVNGEKDAMMSAEVLYVDGDEIPDDKKVGDVKTAAQIKPQGIDQSKLVPLLTKTILELEARITALENA